MNFSRGSSWQEFSPTVSHFIVKSWLQANPNLTPRQIFTNMRAYGINFLTIQVARDSIPNTISGITLYDFNMGRFGSVNAPVNPSEVVTTKSMYDAGLIQINASGMARG